MSLFSALYHHITHQFSNQRGAMFGMDARIALIVASVLAATGGITLMSRLDRSKVDKTEQSLEILSDGVVDYYQNIGITEIPQDLSDLFRENLIPDPLLEYDAWGQKWGYSSFSENITLEGTEITMHFGVIFSPGKDNIADSDRVSSLDEYTSWAPRNDDLGIKFSTRDVDMARLEEYRARGQLIVDKLTSLESTNYLQATGSCESSVPAEWCSDTGGKNYTQFNFYPQSDMDSTDGVVYFESTQGDQTIYQAGNVNDMQELMKRIGLPPEYATDPWNRTLYYHSNITQRPNPPFAASICFSGGGACF